LGYGDGLQHERKSPNLIYALQAAREKQLMTVTFAGKDGGRFPEAADYSSSRPLTASTYRIQEVHAAAVHIVWDIVHIALGEEEDRGSKPLEGRRVVRFDLSWFISQDCALRSFQEVRPAIEHRFDP
jgi:hypothetical protein